MVRSVFLAGGAVRGVKVVDGSAAAFGRGGAETSAT